MTNNEVNNHAPSMVGFKAFSSYYLWNFKPAVGYSAYSAIAAQTYIVSLTAVFDTDSSYDSATGLYTIKRPGVWQFDASFRVPGTVGGGSNMQYIQINNTPGQGRYGNIYVQPGTAHYLMDIRCSCLLNLSVGDTVAPILSWNGPGAYQNYSVFSGHLIN